MGKKLQELIPALEKEHHVGIVAKMSETIKVGVPCCSTGSVKLDLALGGGIPYGQITEIFGENGTGKSSLALSIIKQALDENKEGQAVFIDSEQKLNPKYCEDMGIDLARLNVITADTGEDAFLFAEKVLEAEDVVIVVFDSVARMTPRAIIENDIESSNMGVHARLMSKGLQRLVPYLTKSNAIGLFINQLRVNPAQMFGDPNVTTGGKSLAYYAKIRILIRSTAGDFIKQGKDIVGQQIRVKVVKNQFGTPHKTADFDFIYGQAGFDNVKELVEVAVVTGVIDKKGGGNYYYGEDRLERGEDNMTQLFRDNPELYNEILEQVEAIIYGKDVNKE